VTQAIDIVSILEGLGPYLTSWLSDSALVAYQWHNGNSQGGASSVSGRTIDTNERSQVIHSAEDAALFQPETIFGGHSLVVEEEDTHRLFVGPEAKILGGNFDLSKGSIFIGKGSTIEPGVYVKGPCVIGEQCELRFGAYIRGDVLLGDNVCVRCEMKHSIVMDNGEFCHPGYLGDSICGFGSHFGCQALTANLPLMGSTVVISCIDDMGQNLLVDLQRRKLGSFMGDFCQFGCNSVSEP
jgi:NDP-sugar pyrophosphorylase family protein